MAKLFSGNRSEIQTWAGRPFPQDVL